MRHLTAILILALLAGCAGARRDAPGRTQFDFGPLPRSAAAPAALPPVVMPEADGLPTLDTQRMQYRLDYADPLQARFYANSHWASTPLQLITQRMRARLAQGGARVLPVADSASASYLLRVEVDDFAHHFDSAASSAGVVRLRASLLDGSRLVDQRAFERRIAARSQDAAGGAHALAAAMDGVADDIVAWIAAQPRRAPPAAARQ